MTDEPELLMALTPKQKTDYVHHIANGGAPSAICKLLAIEHDQVEAAQRTDAQFEAAILNAYDRLDENIAAKLYVMAMQGNIAALAIWLRHSPPARWDQLDEPQAPPRRPPGLDIPDELFPNSNNEPDH